MTALAKILYLDTADTIHYDSLLDQSGIRSRCATQAEADREFLRLLLQQYAGQVLAYCNRSLSGVLCPPAPTRNNPSHIHQGGAGSDQGDSDQQQVAAA